MVDPRMLAPEHQVAVIFGRYRLGRRQGLLQTLADPARVPVEQVAVAPRFSQAVMVPQTCVASAMLASRLSTQV